MRQLRQATSDKSARGAELLLLIAKRGNCETESGVEIESGCRSEIVTSDRSNPKIQLSQEQLTIILVSPRSDYFLLSAFAGFDAVYMSSSLRAARNDVV